MFAWICSIIASPKLVGKNGVASALSLAKTNFDGYCKAEVGWHKLLSINLLASAEWAYVSLLALGVILATADLEAQKRVQRNLDTLPVANKTPDDRVWWHFW